MISQNNPDYNDSFESTQVGRLLSLLLLLFCLQKFGKLLTENTTINNKVKLIKVSKCRIPDCLWVHYYWG